MRLGSWEVTKYALKRISSVVVLRRFPLSKTPCPQSAASKLPIVLAYGEPQAALPHKKPVQQGVGNSLTDDGPAGDHPSWPKGSFQRTEGDSHANYYSYYSLSLANGVGRSGAALLSVYSEHIGWLPGTSRNRDAENNVTCCDRLWTGGRILEISYRRIIGGRPNQ